MKIIKLLSENFKRLVAVEIEPTENGLVMVTGKNGMGKSSVLDVIMTTLAGGKSAPDKPIRDGQDKAKNTIITENWIIERTFTEKGSRLTVKNKDGMTGGKPQQLLDKIVGDLTFDPMKFIALGETEKGKREQRTALMCLAGLDFSDLDSDIAKIVTERQQVRRDKERYEGDAERIIVADNLPEKEIDINDLTRKLYEANSHNEKQRETQRDIAELGTQIAQAGLICEKTDDRIKSVEAELKRLRDELSEEAGKQNRLLSEKAGLEENLPDTIDTEEITQAMGEVEATNTFIRQRDNKAELTASAEAEADKYRKLGKKMKDLEQAKAARLSEAKMPLAGLSVTEDCVVYDGIPLSQVNGAKQLEVGLGIAMAQNPELKVILMNGNDLDEDSLAVISKMTADKDFQVWVERIEGEGGIVIEDGMVKGCATVSDEAVEEASDFEKAVKEGQEARASKPETEDGLF